jgi:3',5'-cyclic AMP phosphodiesterase CpdA
MKRALLVLGAIVLLGAAVAWSGPGALRPELDFRLEKRNPVTHLKLNNDPAAFQFAIISDRTGGHRAKVFGRAVEQLNLLQPEFVVSVGDLIEGYTDNRERLTREWREFQGYVAKLQMPFFYVPGNHDIASKFQRRVWTERFGRTYFEFVYRDVLFLILDSEDPPGDDFGRLSDDQLAWLKKVLADNKEVRWTLVFIHKPMWATPKIHPSWDEVEKLLAGRRHTVFAGHVHRYQKDTRNGANYYMLATTGGGSMLRGVEYGEFDHIVWVTMKKEGPVLANILLDGILREDLSSIASDEEGVKDFYRRPTYPVKAKVTYRGQPVPGAYVVFRGSGTEPRQPRADGITEADGSLRLSTYEAFDGLPAGPYSITVEWRKPAFRVGGKQGPNLLPARYADPKTSGLTYTVKAGAASVLDLNLDN